MANRINEIGSDEDDRPYGINSNKLVYEFLCKDRVIQGNPNLDGIVYIGNNKGKKANILRTQKDFEEHCTICTQSKKCIQEQRNTIIKLFETGKFQSTI